MAKKKKTESSAPPSFEEAIEKLEEIVQHLEAGNVGLAESLKLYEEGAGLLKQGQKLLTAAEQRIEQVSGEDADGNPVLKPFEASADAAAEDRDKPRRVRAKSSRKKKEEDDRAGGDKELF